MNALHNNTIFEEYPRFNNAFKRITKQDLINCIEWEFSIGGISQISHWKITPDGLFNRKGNYAIYKWTKMHLEDFIRKNNIDVIQTLQLYKEYIHAEELHSFMRFRCHSKLWLDMDSLIDNKKYNEAIALFYNCNPYTYITVRSDVNVELDYINQVRIV